MMQRNDEWLEIGTIVAAQGIKGQLRVLPTTDFPARLEKPGQRWIQLDEKKQPSAIELLKGNQIPGKNLYIIQLAGIENRNEAENLKGCKLLIQKNDRPELAEDEYHVSDLIDLEVYDRVTAENIGKVIDVFSAGNDLLEIKLYRSQSSDNKPKKNARVFVPFVKEIVPIVDLEAGKIEIDPPTGLLEINQ